MYQDAEPRPVEIPCVDGVVLRGHLWPAARTEPHARVLVDAATGVLSRYYHRYARFLAREGFEVLTFDYRGIGLSRPARLRGSGYRWRHWGERDVDAALRFLLDRPGALPLHVVGHSIGGVLPGLAEHGAQVARMLTVGAQFGHWRDYAPAERRALFLKWHVAMPAMAAVLGYFPGRRLGWLEDLPWGVVAEWSFGGPRLEGRHPRAERAAVVARLAAVRADILAVTMTDDVFATPQGIARTLAYFGGARRATVLLRPQDLGMEEVGHFGLFHGRHEAVFWPRTVRFLRDGQNPWAQAIQ